MCYRLRMTTLTVVGKADRETRNQSIARRIKEQMGGQDLTKQQLGEITGLNRVTLGRRLSGAYPLTIDELELIANALGVSFEWLVTGTGSPRPRPDGGNELGSGGAVGQESLPPGSYFQPGMTGTVVPLHKPTVGNPIRERKTA